MSKAIAKFSIERNEDTQRITIRHKVDKELLLHILVTGLIWLCVVWKWNTNKFSFFVTD